MQGLGQNTRSYKEVFPKRSSIRRNSSEPVRLEIQQQTRPYPVSAPPSPKVKTVRFDEGSLENVHYFLKSDKPLYIGSSASRVDIPYHHIASDGGALAIELSNFPSDTAARQAQLVRLENVWLSGNGDALLGSVSVANLDYHKHVICRFTWDDWRTISFVEARFDPSRSILNKPLEYDCFVFEIGLSHLAEIHSKIMRCCVQYTVNGLQLWDNNNASNYDVVFSKTLKHSLVYQNPGPLDANPHDALDTSNNCVSEHSRHFVTGVSARLYHPLMDIEMPTKGERLRPALYDRYNLTRNLIDAINQKPRGTMCQTAQNWSDRRIRASNAA